MTSTRYSALEKNIAYALDPEAWKSYSGKSRSFKQAIELRRTQTLAKARETLQAASKEEMIYITPINNRVLVTAQTVAQQNHNKVLKGLEIAQTGIEKRAGWIQNRKNQQEELADLAEQLVYAYRSAPYATGALNSLIREIENKSRS